MASGDIDVSEEIRALIVRSRFVNELLSDGSTFELWRAPAHSVRAELCRPEGGGGGHIELTMTHAQWDAVARTDAERIQYIRSLLEQPLLVVEWRTADAEREAERKQREEDARTMQPKRETAFTRDLRVIGAAIKRAFAPIVAFLDAAVRALTGLIERVQRVYTRRV
jgi:hypothetical protein